MSFRYFWGRCVKSGLGRTGGKEQIHRLHKHLLSVYDCQALVSFIRHFKDRPSFSYDTSLETLLAWRIHPVGCCGFPSAPLTCVAGLEFVCPRE